MLMMKLSWWHGLLIPTEWSLRICYMQCNNSLAKWNKGWSHCFFIIDQTKVVSPPFTLRNPRFLKNIDHLFTNGHLWNMPGTYSSFLMETLTLWPNLIQLFIAVKWYILFDDPIVFQSCYFHCKNVVYVVLSCFIMFYQPPVHTLRKVPLLLIHKGKQLVLGGERAITPEIKHRVLGRFLGFGGRSNMSLLLLFLYTKWV